MAPKSIVLPVIFFSILVFSSAIYWPALSGPFLLDDFVHLPRLNVTNDNIDTISEVMRFTFSGPSATRRPLSFFTLLLNDNAWPSNPFGFKYTNLLIHLLNGVLVFILIRQLTSIFSGLPKTSSLDKVNIVALLTMLMWLIHPVNISASMLVIQRMTLLMAMFNLIGLIIYLNGRISVQEQPRRGYLLMSVGVAIFGILGALCKETSIMMVTYIIILESTLFSSIKLYKPRNWKYWFSLFVILPLLLVPLYYVKEIDYMNQLYLKRNFDMPERLMTEARVLLTYLRVIFFPTLSGTGPYHDDFTVSHSLFNPITTLFSVGAIFFAIVFSIRNRKRYPLISFAILWFFLAHSLESTALPLELYFEHRNYLPMLGIVFAVSYWVIFNNNKKLKNIVTISMALFLCLESGISFASSRVWGSDSLISTVWAYEHPASLRAQFDAIRHWLTVGDTEKASNHFRISHENNPNVAGIYLYELIVNKCSPLTVPGTTTDYRKLDTLIPTADFEHASLTSLRVMLDKYKKGKCTIELDAILHLTNLYLQNPKYQQIAHVRSVLYEIEADIYLHKKELSNTINALDHAYAAMHRYDIALMQSYYLMTAGLYQDALHYITVARTGKPHNLYARLWKKQEIDDLERAIELALMKTGSVNENNRTSTDVRR